MSQKKNLISYHLKFNERYVPCISITGRLTRVVFEQDNLLVGDDYSWMARLSCS